MTARESIGVPVSKHAGWLEEARGICLDHGMVQVLSRVTIDEVYIFSPALGPALVVFLHVNRGQWSIWGRKGKDLGKLRAKVLGASIQGGGG